MVSFPQTILKIQSPNNLDYKAWYKSNPELKIFFHASQAAGMQYSLAPGEG